MDFQLRPDRDLTILIPARAGSKRIPGKNTKLLGGKPLIEWSIESAFAANPERVIISTDSKWIVDHVTAPESMKWHIRKPEHATDDSPDIEWVLDVLPMVETPYVAICRPTSPFRTASTIRRGFALLVASNSDSIRAVEKITYPHPAKMWRDNGREIVPVMQGFDERGTPWHSMPTQLLPKVYTQNASLEMARTGAIRQTRRISGVSVSPFFTDPTEGFDINTPEDWARAEAIASTLR